MNYIVATNRNWEPDLVNNISRRTGKGCTEINRKEDLTSPLLDKIKPEIIFFPFWSEIIRPEIYENYECIVFHMTDLPFGRGGSPLQNLIVRGFQETKISALRCTADIDAGPVYLKQPLSLSGSAQEIYKRAAHHIEDMIVKLIMKKTIPQAQQGKVIEFKRRRPEDGDISKLSSLKEVYNYIRMLDANGYPSAFIELDDLKLEFRRAKDHGNYVTANVTIKVKNDD